MGWWLPKTMAFSGEPENDEVVEKHGQRGSPFDRPAAPALRFLEAEALLAVTEGDLDAPPHRVPAKDLLSCRFVTGRVEGFLASPAFKGLAGHDFEGSIRRGEHAGNLVGDATAVRPTVDRKRDATACAYEHIDRAGQPLPTLAWPAVRTLQALGPDVVQSSCHQQATCQIAVARQLRKDVLSSVGAIGDDVKPPVFVGRAQDTKHLDTQFRPGAVLAAMLRHALPIDVQPKEQRQEDPGPRIQPP